MTDALVTGASCDDPAGGHSEDNFLKRSSLEIEEGPRVGWSLTTSSALCTQVANLSCGDY